MTDPEGVRHPDHSAEFYLKPPTKMDASVLIGKDAIMKWTPDGPIGTPDEMRRRLELWRRQQAALERGEDPTKIEVEINEGARLCRTFGDSSA